MPAFQRLTARLARLRASPRAAHGAFGGAAGEDAEMRGGVPSAAAIEHPPPPPLPPPLPPPPDADAAGAAALDAPPSAPQPAAAAPPTQDAPPDAAAPQPMCCVCMDAPLQVAFMPCGHMAACVACGERVMSAGAQRRDGARCPICGEATQRFMRVFLCAA
jgi:hypothetical protein